MLLTFIGSVLARCTFALQPSSQLALGTIVAITAILNAPVKPLLDSAVLSMIADKSAYGKSRLFGQLGFGLGSFFTGRYLNNNMQNVFIAHAAFMVPTAIIMTTFRPKVVNNTEHESTSENNNKKGGKKKGDFGGTKISKRDLFRELRTVLLKPKNFIFFFVVFSIGVSSGIIENFAYIRIGEVAKLAKNTDSNVLGTCRLVSSLAGGPMFWLSGKVLDLLGINGVLTASLVAYIARFFIYATITNPWHAIPAEILRGATFATFWSGCTYYVYNISPPGLSATMVSSIKFVLVMKVSIVVVMSVINYYYYQKSHS